MRWPLRTLGVAVVMVASVGIVRVVREGREGDRLPSDPRTTAKSHHHCVYGSWSRWSRCLGCPPLTVVTRPGPHEVAATTATRVRTRKVLSESAMGACGLQREESPCHASCDSDGDHAHAAAAAADHRCTPASWSPWGVCRTSCGFGNRNRTRDLHGELCHQSDLPQVEMQRCPEPRPLCTIPHSAASMISDTAPYTATQPRVSPISIDESTLLGCGDLDKVRLVDSEPFARGFSKEVWRGMLLDGDTPVVVKRPIDAETARRFAKSILWEEAWLKRYHARPEFIRFFGSCRDDSVSTGFEVVEGALVKWEFVMNATTVPWCLRLDLATQVARIVRLLGQERLVHCDWKYDQLAIDLNGRAKIVDVKSIRWLPATGRPFKSDRQCGMVKRRQMRGCQVCMKQLDLPVEHACNATTGQCRGYDLTSLVAATGLSIFQPMLVVHLADAPDAAFVAAIAELVKGSTRSEPLHRWSIDLIVTHLEELGARYSSAKCMADTDHRSVIRNAYHTMVSGRKARCAKRYC